MMMLEKLVDDVGIGFVKPWDPNVSHCDLIHSWTFPKANVTIHDPSMVPSAGLGILTGLIGCLLIIHQKYPLDVNTQRMYAMTFATFACMNTTGLLNWCFFDHDDPDLINKTHLWVLLLDGTFSSLTSLNFFFCALSDYGFLKVAANRLHLLLVLIFYIAIYYGYQLSVFGKWYEGWVYLYVDLTRYSSLAYFGMTMLKMVTTRNFKGVCPLLTSIVVGLTGLNILQNAEIQNYFCHWMNGYFAGMDIWYLQSDTSLICLLIFYFVRHTKKEEATELRKPLLLSQV